MLPFSRLYLVFISSYSHASNCRESISNTYVVFVLSYATALVGLNTKLISPTSSADIYVSYQAQHHKVQNLKSILRGNSFRERQISRRLILFFNRLRIARFLIRTTLKKMPFCKRTVSMSSQLKDLKGCESALDYTAFFFSIRSKVFFAFYGTYLLSACDGKP